MSSTSAIREMMASPVERVINQLRRRPVRFSNQRPGSGQDCEVVTTSSGQLDTVTGGKAFTKSALKIDGVVPAAVIGG